MEQSASQIDVKKVVEEFQDHLALKLDTYEQAIYLFIFRHSRLIGLPEVTIGFKSSRRRMSFGIGEHGKPMSEGTCYKKLQSLQSKGCVKILNVLRNGTRIRLLLPSEIAGTIPESPPTTVLRLEDMDFFNEPKNRLAILSREKGKCFYCLRDIDASNYVMEHVVSRPGGNNSYSNVVAACRSCNNRKGKESAEDFLRYLHRGGYLSASEFEGRVESIRQLARGEHKPILNP